MEDNTPSSDYFQVLGLALTTTLYMAFWQFGQFALFSQMCCLFPVYAIGLMSKDTFNIILKGQLVRNKMAIQVNKLKLQSNMVTTNFTGPIKFVLDLLVIFEILF